jgi:hypothetical protein
LFDRVGLTFEGGVVAEFLLGERGLEEIAEDEVGVAIVGGVAGVAVGELAGPLDGVVDGGAGGEDPGLLAFGLPLEEMAAVKVRLLVEGVGRGS